MLDHRVLCLVFSQCLAALRAAAARTSASLMSLATSILTLASLTGFLLGFVSLGSIALRALRRDMFSDTEFFLVSAAIGLTVTEVLFFLFQLTNHFRLGALALIVVLGIAVILDRRSLRSCLLGAFRSALPASAVERLLLTSILVVASIEFLVSMAPLTGSDALHYHFTVQKLVLQQGFHPIFSNSHSFLCGQQHLLILLGLALRSEHLALGFIFLGGILSATSMACLISRWASYISTALFTLVFLLTPLVFWQISTSGAPDVYMAFLACVAVIVLTKKFDTTPWQQVALAGLLAGAIAGSKYTGCLIAASFLLAVAIEFRSIRYVLLFTLASLISGCWPYLRNVVWTGNPVFPFLSAWFSPHLVNAYALQDLATDTGFASAHHFSQLIPFIFLASMPKQSLGFWDYFGPTVFAISPLALLAYRNSRAWRTPLLVWFLSAAGIFFSSGLPRFLLPVYPIALSFVAVGIEAVSQKKLIFCRNVALAIVVLMIVTGAAGFGIYSRAPLIAALGLQSKTEYLEQSSQEYQVVETVNHLLAGQAWPQKTALVFIRHTYYLDVPYLNGSPGTGFVANPDLLRTEGEWQQFFDKHDIGYVVRSPNYPPAIAAGLTGMEKSGRLTLFKQAEVQDFRGKRIDHDRTTIQVVIFRVMK
ncbi:MAG TPA: hypothetical protein VMU53_07690 [Candidatus Sulfotelmatobacter sp.]|nr:hypothetical protein [Candidatus Sulfotelmatobacter sp.]